MKRLLAAVFLLLTSGVAIAQEHPTPAEKETIALLEAKADASKVKLKLVDSAYVGSLKSEGFERVFVTIDPKKSYAVIGACEEACTNFDIVVWDSAGSVIDSDLQPDDSPVAMIEAGPKPSGQVKLFLSMKDCSQPTCVYAVGLYEVMAH